MIREINFFHSKMYSVTKAFHFSNLVQKILIIIIKCLSFIQTFFKLISLMYMYMTPKNQNVNTQFSFRFLLFPYVFLLSHQFKRSIFFFSCLFYSRLYSTWFNLRHFYKGISLYEEISIQNIFFSSPDIFFLIIYFYGNYFYFQNYSIYLIFHLSHFYHLRKLLTALIYADLCF